VGLAAYIEEHRYINLHWQIMCEKHYIFIIESSFIKFKNIYDIDSPGNENFNLMVRIKFLNLVLYSS
jgi:hypothetical protein